MIISTCGETGSATGHHLPPGRGRGVTQAHTDSPAATHGDTRVHTLTTTPAHKHTRPCVHTDSLTLTHTYRHTRAHMDTYPCAQSSAHTADTHTSTQSHLCTHRHACTQAQTRVFTSPTDSYGDTHSCNTNTVVCMCTHRKEKRRRLRSAPQGGQENQRASCDSRVTPTPGPERKQLMRTRPLQEGPL